MVPAVTTIQIEIPKNKAQYHTVARRPYVTLADRIYDKESVWDAVAVYNDRDDVLSGRGVTL